MLFHDQPSVAKKASSAVAVLLVNPSFLLTAVAQDFPKPPASGEQSASNASLPVIKTESRIVLVDAVVTDKKGDYIRDLTQRDFRVYEDNNRSGKRGISNDAGRVKSFFSSLIPNSSTLPVHLGHPNLLSPETKV
jgi:hypothetical protein